MAFGNSSKKALIAVIKILITVAIVAYIVRTLGWANIVSSLTEADQFLLFISLAVFFISGLLGSIQWHILLKNKGVLLPFIKTFNLYFIGMFFNNFMVGMVAGDAVRIALIKSNRGSIKAGFAATFLDRFSGLFAMMLFAVVGSIILLSRGLINNRSVFTASAAFCVTFAIFCIICVFLISRRAQRLFFRFFDAVPLPGKIKIGNIIKELAIEVHNRHILIPVALLAAVVQLLRIAVHILCAASMGLLTFDNFQYFFIFVPVIAILMMIPLPFGIKEGIEGSLLILAGFSPDTPEAPVVLGFLASIIGVTASLLGGIFFVVGKLRKREEN